MADKLTPESRSRNMARVKGKNTKPEKTVRSLLFGLGYRYRLHLKDLPGKPDIVFTKAKKAVFVHGCFWHGHDCRKGKRPGSNPDFWNKKLDTTIERDRRNLEQLSNLGYSSLVIWECELKDPQKLTALLEDFLK